ncbi:MAG: hypothetical protein KF900_00490 [Bacteroidetes bacterium]|nr:hypothetical protein [Bacteroidota bacterium]
MAQAQNIDNQIAGYVSRLSVEKKKAVLTLLKRFDDHEEDNYHFEFEKKWADSIPLDEGFRMVHEHISSLKWKK